jgi:aryl-alcohol dehydrogenase-like predicted oxidoreductase
MRKREFGLTGLQVAPIGLGGYPFGGINRAANWDPFSHEGRRTAIATIHRALDCGINYVDTAPGYGDGNSERIFGDALRGRRDQIVLATKCPWAGDAEAVRHSIAASLERLQTDYIDIMQFHGGMFTPEQAEHILGGGPLDALQEARETGRIRFLGFTCEEPWTARPLIASRRFDVVQLRYNLIYQSAALHALNEARDTGLGVAVMRPMTSGILQRTVRFLQPAWPAETVFELALKFVLSDSRVHVANVGMRWPEEVDRNVALAEAFTPPLDVAELPRLTAGIYQAEDRDAAGDA